jgi:carbonic anhydrase
MATHPSFFRRQWLQWSNLALLAGAVVTWRPIKTVASVPAPETSVITADKALEQLLQGNQRFAENMAQDPNQSLGRRMMVATGQQPFATIFSCVDSRVPPEIVFDRGLGDLFVIRTAGHVIDNAVLGSLEFGAAELGIPLILVMGHERCGAVKATLETIEAQTTAPAQIGTLVAAIAPAVAEAKTQAGDLLDNAIRANTELVVNQLKAAPLLSDAIGQGKLKIVGARYDLDSGLVEVIVP